MKKFLVGILLLLSSFFQVAACGFGPDGEDVRYRFLNLNHYGMESFQGFYYHFNVFNPSNDNRSDFDDNVKDWHKYLNKKVDLSAIEQFLYHYEASDLNKESTNEFVKYLYANNKTAAINYLYWAKQCEAFTTIDDNKSWERDEEKRKISATNFLKKLKDQLNNEKDPYFKRRFAFLSLRLAYYAGDENAIKSLYKTHFAGYKKDFMYYWSLYFYCFTDEKRDIDLANIARYSPDKRNAVFYYFRKSFSLEKALSEANSDEERVNAYAFVSMLSLDYQLNALNQMYSLSKKNQQLDFLLLREISKLEDWIYTPYYTYYFPSIESYYDYVSDDENSYEKYLANSLVLKKKGELKARAYAKDLLNFVRSVDLSKVDSPMVWKSAMIQLQFMSQDYNGCIQNGKLFLKKYASENASVQVEKIMILASVAKQIRGKATIPTEYQDFVLKNLGDERFKFALARELEYLGNYGDAVALMSRLSSNYSYDDNNGMVFWQFQRKQNNRAIGSLVEFFEYFGYIDYAYSISQLEAVMKGVENHPKSKFYDQLYGQLKKDKNYILDLLGMKYIRQNDLKGALAIYEAMDQTYWENNYSAWERDEYDNGYYCFDKNPFYQLKYTSDFIEPNAKIKLTKVTVLKQLLYHLERAEDSKNQRRDKDFFYVATCYYNMSQYGNSWMMRRFASTWYYHNENPYYNEMYEDEEEYRNNLLAQKYYLLAEKYSTNEKFKALCFRMYEFALYTVDKSDDDEMGRYDELLKKYPNHYRQLSTCENLRAYFK